MTIAIRRYRAEDCDGTITAFRSAVRGIASRDYDAAQIAAWAEVDRAKWAERRAMAETWVAVDGETVIGFADLVEGGVLDMMYVAADHQRDGVASLLLETIEQAGRARGYGRLTTEASITARPFFTRRGFSVIAEQDVALRGQTFRNYLMDKQL